jgi:hypothetical protein
MPKSGCVFAAPSAVAQHLKEQVTALPPVMVEPVVSVGV